MHHCPSHFLLCFVVFFFFFFGNKFCQVYIILVKYKGEKKNQKKKSYKIIILHYFLFIMIKYYYFLQSKWVSYSSTFFKAFPRCERQPWTSSTLGASVYTYKCESKVENPLEMLINCWGNQLHTGTGPVKTHYHLAEW